MDHSAPVEVDAHELERAQHFWNNFVSFVKIGIGVVVALLLAMMFVFFVI